MEKLPLFIAILFGLTTLLTVIWFYLATRSKVFLVFILGWAVLQSLLGFSGIYQDTESLPPRLLLFGILPALVLIIATFVTTKGKAFIDQINLKTLTYFHSIRLPVEIVLSLLFHYGVMSVYITFEGTNFDIFSGVSAPIVAYLAFNGRTKKKLLLGWNILCLLLLLNVVITALFCFPFPFQKLAFDQPNLALLYFPYNLLPTLIVPLVLFGHLIAIRQLSRKNQADHT